MKSLKPLILFALRNLNKKRSYSLSVIASLGVSVGALLCILSFSYLIVFKPLPYPDSDKLYVLSTQFLDGNENVKGEAFNYPSIIYLQNQQNAFEASSHLYFTEQMITSTNQTSTTNVTFADGNWFNMLNIDISMGRGFDQRENAEKFNPNVVISYQAWEKLFNKNPDIIGEQVDLSGQGYTVVGVTSKQFIEPKLYEADRLTDFWVAWDYNPVAESDRRNWSRINGALVFVGRLQPGLPFDKAEQKITALIDPKWRDEVSDKSFFDGWSLNAKLVSLKDKVTGDSVSVVWLILFGILGLVVITAANIAALMMSRVTEQGKVMAIQASVGARVKHLFMDRFIETLILMSIATLVAIGVALLGFELLKTYFSHLLPRTSELSLDMVTLFLAIGIGLFLSLLFAGVSAGVIKLKDLANLLKVSGKGAGIQLARWKQQAVIFLQVLIASVVIFATLNVALDARQVLMADTGFELNNTSYLVLDKTSSNRLTEEAQAASMSVLKSAIGDMSEVEAVSQAGSPLSKFSKMAITEVSTDTSLVPLRKKVDHDYFSLLAQPIREGRTFSENEVRQGVPVAVINEAMANQLHGDVIGARLSAGRDSIYEVIGVVKNIHIPNEDSNTPRIYTPVSGSADYFLIKFRGNLATLQSRLADVIASTTPEFAIYQFETLKSSFTSMVMKQIVVLAISTVLAILIIGISGIGIYGIINNTVQQRKFELGTRISIGAKRNDLFRLVLLNNLLPVVGGVALLFVMAVIVYSRLPELIVQYGMTQLITTFSVTIFIVFSLATLASYLPLRPFFNRPPALLLRNS